MLNNKAAHEHDQSLLWYTACISDTIFKPLYEFAQKRNLFGYTGTLQEVAHWAHDFFDTYHHRFEDWDEFEESESNIYNSSSWDDFLTCWADDRLEKFKQQYSHVPDLRDRGYFHHAGVKTAKLVVVIKHQRLSAIYSNRPIQYAQLLCNWTEQVPFHLAGFFDADTQADQLYTLFDADDPNQSSVREQLRIHGF